MKNNKVGFYNRKGKSDSQLLNESKEIYNKRIEYLNDLKENCVNGEVLLSNGSILTEAFINKEIQNVIDEWESIQ